MKFISKPKAGRLLPVAMLCAVASGCGGNDSVAVAAPPTAADLAAACPGLSTAAVAAALPAVDPRCIQPAGTAVEPCIRPLRRMAVAPDVHEAFRSHANVQLRPGSRVRFLRSQSRVRVLSGQGDVPVADHDDGAVLS